MQIKNTHSTALGLPDGTEIPAKGSAPVDNWDQVKKNAAVKAWLAAGILVEPAKAAAGNEDADKAERDALLAKLEALGEKPDKRTGLDKLKLLLAEAEKKAAAGNGG